MNNIYKGNIFIYIIIIFFIYCYSFNCFAIEEITDTIKVVQSNTEKNITLKSLDNSKSTLTAISLSFLMPGLGQVYVEKYWKAPIFFATASVLWYYLIDNHIKANNYKKKIDEIVNTNSTELNYYKERHEDAIDNRDISSLYLIGVYTLAAIDAYVGVYLFDFNIGSNNLKLYTIPRNIDNGIILNINFRF